MKILIIGVEGFVGGHFVDLLNKSKKYKIFGTYLNRQTSFSNVDLTKLDITNEFEVNNIINLIKPQIIVHFASQSSVGKSWEEPLLTVNVNIIGVINLLNAVKNNIPKSRVILIGSSEEYGKTSNGNKQINEFDKTNPSNIYALTKLAQTNLGRIYFEAYGLDVIMTRSFNHFGPKQSPNFVISDFCKQIVEMENNSKIPKIIKVGNLNLSRDFTDVRDIVRAYLELIEKGISGEIYNVGSGKFIDLKKILDIIISNSKVFPKIVIDDKKIRPTDVPVIYADISKIKSILNWSPIYSLEQSIEDTLMYWRKEFKSKKI